MIRRALAAAACLASACGTPQGAEPGRCEGNSSAAVSVAGRKLLGAASPYPADGSLRGRDAALAGSQRLRREVAWQIAARVLEPVPLAHDVPAVPAAVPRWQSWYGRDDIHRVFQRLFRGLSSDQQRARVRFPDESIDQAFAWNPRAIDDEASWPEERWRDYVASLDQAAEVGGAAGIGRAAYSPGAARHLLASYVPAVQCLEAGAPDGFADGPGAGVRRLVREPLTLAACERRVLGPYFVDGGDGLHVTTGPHADVAIRVGARDAEIACAGQGTCEVVGPGPTWIEITAGPDGLAGAAEVEYAEADPAWAACLDGAFPMDAAVVKADWRRADIGDALPTYDTSAAGIGRRLVSGGDADWGGGDGAADPGPDDIYTVSLPTGQVFRLAALHVMTKELDHWMWLTLWWSPEPDSDFGEDRPAAIGGLGGPWRNYKMCAVSGFAEDDPDPRGGYGETSLGRALEAARATGDTAWCSNPYLEVGHGNAASTCVGCHQHGGTDVTSEAILADEARFPARGRAAVRNNFPADYAWALDAGDAFAPMFRDEIDYWTTP